VLLHRRQIGPGFAAIHPEQAGSLHRTDLAPLKQYAQ